MLTTEKVEVESGSDSASKDTTKNSRNWKRTRHVHESDGIISVTSTHICSVRNLADNEDLLTKPVTQLKGKEREHRARRKVPPHAG